ncbi:muramoyltetrapeptide carboxypeptidase [Arcticibacter pallidicorallinus]|uniref:Muramoyltetrapeptide carboxypeptidase n=1 Tax=Arcticibacter pallidicorallinus TaxID=1259464 RepID=A0A2T0U7B2_9SPHI|nr:LD-carboxypeptidase [Arcticibacter pallidicorallinus]PRY53811.1 muramoyltetrapeptide carboxypeptidase [Arcticibacter pallidicorallinus]
MITPPYLKKGDKIAITCPAKSLPGDITSAVRLLESWGLEVILGDTVKASHHQFAGDDELRTKDLQRFLDDPSVKAIIAARGGYGTIRIIDRLDFTSFLHEPKWIVGFSDITVLHSHIHATCNVQTIHGQMPLNVPDGTKPSLESLRKALFGESINYSYESSTPGRSGSANGKLIGGNLTLLVMMSGSISEMSFRDKILFIEDVGEYYYSIDRMLWQLKRAGKLSELKGLIVGGFTDLKDNATPFGESLQEMVMNHVKEYDYPVAFEFPAGHIPDNHALIFGRDTKLDVMQTGLSLSFI